MQNTGMQGSAPSAGNVAEQAPAAIDRLSDTAHQTMERVTQAASQAAARLRERGEELWALEGRALDTARSYVREHPIATVAIAVAVGLIISRLTSRR